MYIENAYFNFIIHFKSKPVLSYSNLTGKKDRYEDTTFTYSVVCKKEEEAIAILKEQYSKHSIDVISVEKSEVDVVAIQTYHIEYRNPKL